VGHREKADGKAAKFYEHLIAKVAENCRKVREDPRTTQESSRFSLRSWRQFLATFAIKSFSRLRTAAHRRLRPAAVI
jgi:hypothetical protein